MPIQITITADNASEANQLVQDLASTMAQMDPADVPEKTEVSTVDSEKPKKPEKPKKEQEKSSDDQPIPSVVDLRAKAQEKGKTPERKKAIKALLEEFGYPSISAIDESDRAAFMTRLEAL